MKAALCRLFYWSVMTDILEKYGKLLAEIDAWFAGASSAYPKQINCGKGCSGCCRALFDITLLDARYLQQGFTQLAQQVQNKIGRAHV